MVKLNSRSSRLKRRQHDKRVTAELFRTDCFNTTPHRERVHGLSEPVRELPEQVRESPEPVRESPEPVPEAPEQRTSRFIEDFRDGPSQPSPHLIKSQGEPLDLVEKHFSKQAQREQAVLPRVLVREEVCEQVQRGQELLRRERRRGQQGKRLTAHCAEEQRYICRSNNASESKRKPRRPLLRVHPLSEFTRSFLTPQHKAYFIDFWAQPEGRHYFWWWDLRSQAETKQPFQWPLYTPCRVDQLLLSGLHNLAIIHLCSAGRNISVREDPCLLPRRGAFLEPVRPIREISCEEALHILNISPYKANISPDEVNISPDEANISPSEVMAPVNPSPLTWTLRFKYGKNTVVLHADPLQTFDSLKTELLRALTQTSTDGTLNEIEIPTSPDDIILGVPADPNNLSTTKWTRLIVGMDTLDDEENGLDIGVGPGKRKNAKAKAKTSAALNSPQGQGLKDGSVLAFKFRHEGDEGNDMGDDRFDVKIPSYDDPYDGAEEDEEVARGRTGA